MGLQHTAVARRANLHGARRALALIDAEAKVCAGSHASTCAAAVIYFLGGDLPEDAYVLSTAFGYCLYLIYLQVLTTVCAGSTRGKCSVKNTPEILACGSAERGKYASFSEASLAAAAAAATSISNGHGAQLVAMCVRQLYVIMCQQHGCQKRSAPHSLSIGRRRPGAFSSSAFSSFTSRLLTPIL